MFDQTYSRTAVNDDFDEWLGTTTDDTDAIVLHRFFVDHSGKIGQELLSHGKPNEGDPDEGKQAWSAVCLALLAMGDPLEVPKRASSSRAEHEGYIDLMERYNHRNSDALRDIFVETSMPEVGTSDTQGIIC